MKRLSEKQLDRIANESAWDVAITDYMVEGSTKDLEKLLASRHPIPDRARAFLADVLRGTVRPPDLRGKKNSTLSPAERDAIQAELWSVWSRTICVLAHIDEIADEQGKEVLEIKRYIEGVRREAIERIAARYGITTNTVRQLHDARETTAWIEHIGVFGVETAKACMRHPELFYGLTE